VTSALLVADMITLIRALGLENPFAAGHSMGADIAGRLAAACPLRAVVLVDPALQNFVPASLLAGDTMPPWMQPILDAMAALKTQ